MKYLLGECTPQEKGRVQAWKAENESNQKEFEKLAILWEQSREISQKSTVNADEAWERFKQLRDQKDRGALPAKVLTLQPNSFRMVSIAAALLVILGIGFLFRMIGVKQEPVPVQVALLKIQSANATLTDTLPDGSVISLNKNSMVEYPEVFSDSIRSVKMEGEVFFNIAKNSAKPFIISTQTGDIKVVGTSFNVKNRKGSTEVIVETGIVEVSYNRQKVELTPGKQVKVNSGDSVLQVQNTANTLYQYFRNRQFICDNTPLSELAIILNEAYSVNIVIEKQSIRNLRLTTTFSDESLENILAIIEQTFGIKAIQKGDSILIQ